MVAVVSAANASLYSSSRILWYLGKSKQTPQLFTRVTKKGVPIVALLSTILLSGLFLSMSTMGNGVFFNYIIQISSLSGFLVWLGIALSHYQFRKKYLVAKNIAIEQLSYRSKLFPSATVASIFIILTVIIGQVFTLDASKRDMYSLFITYFSLLIFLSIYLIH